MLLSLKLMMLLAGVVICNCSNAVLLALVLLLCHLGFCCSLLIAAVVTNVALVVFAI